MMRVAILTAVLTLWVGGAPGFAQSISYPEGKPGEIGPDLRGVGDGVLRCFIHCQDAPLLGAPEPGAQVHGTLDFMDQYWIAQMHSAGGETYVLLVHPVDAFDLRIRQVFGWTLARYCLMFTGSGPRATRDERTNINRKAMLVNDLSQPSSEDLLRSDAAFFDRIDGDAKELSRRGLFEIYYVYDETPEQLFLGTEPNVARDTRRSEILLGWVPKSRVCQWNTREAIEFNKQDIKLRTQPALIFATEDAVREYLDARPRPTTEELRERTPPVLLASESMENEEEWAFDLPRYPVLSGATEDSEQVVRGNHIYQIGIIGHVYGADNRVLIQRQLLAKLQGEADNLLRRASTIQVAFVIDATFSMKQWLPVMRNAVSRIVNDVRNMNVDQVAVDNVSFSVNFYRSMQEKTIDGMYEGNPFGDERAAIDLLDHANPRGGKGQQQVFYAIRETLRTAGFSPEATKIMIVIGDDGDGGGEAKMTEESIAGELIKAGGSSPVGFFAVAVGNPNSPEHARFVQQSRRIGQLMADHQKQTILKRLAGVREETGGADERHPGQADLDGAIAALTGQTLVSDSSDQILTAISERFRLAVLEAKYRRELIKNLRTGTTAAPRGPSSEADPYGLVWEQQTMDLIHSRGLDELLKAQQGVQLFKVGWTFERHPDEIIPAGWNEEPLAIRHTAFMHHSEVSKFKNFLQALLSSQDADTEQRARMAWKSALEKLTGDAVVDESLSPERLAQMYWGIQATKGFLSYSYDEIGGLDPRRKADLLLDLDRHVKQLTDVVNEQDATYEKRPPKEGDFDEYWERINPRTHPYWWPQADLDINYIDRRAWIDRSLLP